MEHSRFYDSYRQATVGPSDLAQKGFALVSLLAIVPLAFALMVALALGFFVLKKKTLAQSHCVQQASLLQNELKSTLDQLLKLNRRARVLRRKREMADKALRAAIKSKVPHLIAAATAAKTAVYLQQFELSAEQKLLLRKADQQREIGHRQLRGKLSSLLVHNFNSKRFYWRPLAVEAMPLASLTPDYLPLPAFEQLQQHRFRFDVPLDPYGKIVQKTECSVSLKGKENTWKVQIVAANARSNWSWF